MSPDSSISTSQSQLVSHMNAITKSSHSSPLNDMHLHNGQLLMQPKQSHSKQLSPNHHQSHLIGHHGAASSPSTIRVQVQECSQSAAMSSHRSPIQYHSSQSTSMSMKSNSAAVSTITSGPNLLARERYSAINGNTSVNCIATNNANNGGPSSGHSNGMNVNSNENQQQDQSISIMHQQHQPKQMHQQRVVMPQSNVIYKVSSRPLTPEYTKSYPVMDTTVASSVKGEPELNIGKTMETKKKTFPSSHSFAFTPKNKTDRKDKNIIHL